MSLPSLSIITATYNASRDLPGLLASLRAQTDRDFQYVVMDGGSKDATAALVAAACDLTPQWHSEPDFGFFHALNKAVQRVSSEYYLVAGADDRLHPEAVARYKAWARHHGADLVIAGVRAGSAVRRGYHPRRAWLGPAYMFTSHSVGTLIRTALHDHFGLYSLRYPIFADSLFMRRVAMSPDVRVVAADFVAGEFNVQGGLSKTDPVRSLCELWMTQRECGEGPFLQWLLFQGRMLWNFRRLAT